MFFSDFVIHIPSSACGQEPSLEEIVAGLPDEAKRLIEELGLVAISA